MSRLQHREGTVPLRVWRAAGRQWAGQVAALWFRSWLLRLPLPALHWLIGRYRFDWIGDRLVCDVNRCLVGYWGSYVAPPGWHLVEAVHRVTGRRHFALRARVHLPLIGGCDIRLGHRIKPAFGSKRITEDKGVCFEFKRNA